MSRFSVTLFQRIDAPRKDGSCLVCLRVFINRARFILSLDIAVQPEQFNARNRCIVYDRKFGIGKQEVENYNRIMEAAYSKAVEINTRYFLSRVPLTIEKFRAEFTGANGRNDFLEYMLMKIKEVNREGSTIKAYGESLKKAAAYKKEWMVHEINHQLIERFDVWMARSGLGINTRWKHHKTIRTFIRMAVMENIGLEDPYQKFKPARTSGNRCFLEEAEIRLLFELYDSGELPRHLQQILARFLFCCFTGLRISDSRAITSDNIINDQLIFLPQKTKRFGKIMKIHLNQTALSFVKKSLEVQFHAVTDQHTNLGLKEIARILGLQKKITFHVARHTFASQFLMHGGKVEVLKELLGHSKIETTMLYVHLVDQQKKDQIMNLDKIRTLAPA